MGRGFATEDEMQRAVEDVVGLDLAPKIMPILAVFKLHLVRLDEAIALVLLMEQEVSCCYFACFVPCCSVV